MIIDAEPDFGLSRSGGTMSIAFFDCFSGIAGDMALGALIDAVSFTRWDQLEPLYGAFYNSSV